MARDITPMLACRAFMNKCMSAVACQHDWEALLSHLVSCCPLMTHWLACLVLRVHWIACRGLMAGFSILSRLSTSAARLCFAEWYHTGDGLK